MNNKDVAATAGFHACSRLGTSSARLPQRDAFLSSATRKTYLVALPGDLLFEIYLRDENSHLSFFNFLSCIIVNGGDWL